MPTICKFCKGAGRKIIKMVNLCPRCQDDYIYKKDCDLCNHTGWKIQELDQICDGCYGQGKFSNAEAASYHK